MIEMTYLDLSPRKESELLAPLALPCPSGLHGTLSLLLSRWSEANFQFLPYTSSPGLLLSLGFETIYSASDHIPFLYRKYQFMALSRGNGRKP